MLDWVVAIFGLVAFFLFLRTYLPLAGLTVYGHDEVHYYDDFLFKLKEEGRWINFLSHGVLRWIPLQVHVILFLLCTWGFCFFISYQFERDLWFSVLTASTLSLGVPFVLQSLWPATLLPSNLALMLLCYLAWRGTSAAIVYVIGGTLLFGMMQNYYFALPLLFVGRFQLDSIGTKALFAHVGWWILGSVCGVLVSISAVYLITGQLGIHPAEWRQTHPARDLAGLIRNFESVGTVLLVQFRHLWIAAAGAAGLAYFSLTVLLVALRWRAILANWRIFLILLASGLGFFVFSIPLAPIIETRSLTALSCATFLFVFVFCIPRRGVVRLLVAAMLLWAAGVLSHLGFQYIEAHDQNTVAIRDRINDLLPADRIPRKIAIFGKLDSSDRYARTYNEPPLLRPIVLSMGAAEFWDCRVPSHGCKKVYEQLAMKPGKFREPQIIGIHEDVLAIAWGDVLGY